MSRAIRLKVCGMREHDNIRDVAALGPDYMGFIFYAGSPRFVGPEFTIPSGFPAAIKRVGVFVNAGNEEILGQVTRLALDYVQLHGDESVAQVRELRARNVGIIKVFSIDETFDFTKLNAYEPHVDFFLFDTKGRYYGGNAMAFDWTVLAGYTLETPFFLSGGLNANNVKNVGKLNTGILHALDINSGVEIAPGVKDPSMIRTLCDAIY